MKRVTTSSNSNQRKPTSPLEYLRGTNFYPISSLLQLQLHQSYRDKLELELELHLNFAETNFSTCSSPTATLTSHLWQGCQTSVLKKSQLISCLQGWSFCPTSKRWTISKTKGQLPYPGSIPHRLVRRFIFFPHRWKDWFLTLSILIALHRRISWSRVEGSFGGSWIKCLIHF